MTDLDTIEQAQQQQNAVAMMTQLVEDIPIGSWEGPSRITCRRVLDALEAKDEALREAIEVIEWCCQNDKTQPYTYDPRLLSTRRRDGKLPGKGKAYNTPHEFAAYWVPKLRSALSPLPTTEEGK